MPLEVFDRKFAQKLPGEIAVTHLNVSPIACGKQGALLSFWILTCCGLSSQMKHVERAQRQVGFVPSDDLRSLAEFKQKLCCISLHYMCDFVRVVWRLMKVISPT